MTPEIQQALKEIGAGWPNAEVTHEEDGDGNVFVLVESMEIGSQYSPAKSWIGFQLQPNYPDPDVYPHFISGEVTRVDETELGEGFSATDWRKRKAIQVSRRTANWNGAIDTAESKLIKVLDWIRSRK